jgi:hypothetical protein
MVLDAHPAYKNALGQRRVRILDLDESELDTAVGELVDKIDQLTLCKETV